MVSIIYKLKHVLKSSLLITHKTQQKMNKSTNDISARILKRTPLGISSYRTLCLCQSYLLDVQVQPSLFMGNEITPTLWTTFTTTQRWCWKYTHDEEIAFLTWWSPPPLPPRERPTLCKPYIEETTFYHAKRGGIGYTCETELFHTCEPFHPSMSKTYPIHVYDCFMSNWTQ